MPLYINTNVPSLTVQRHMATGTGALNKVYARLSSGLRINSAGDDAAGLGITNRMTAQIRGLTQAIRNANDGISVSQVAEGAMAEDANMLQRISELSVQAANATNSDSDRQSLQEEVTQLLAEIDRVSQETEFNGWAMLKGGQEPLLFQVGAKEGQIIQVNLADARARTLLAQAVAVDPNSPASLNNKKIDGLTITAPNPPLEGSKLFASSLATMVNAVASGDNSQAATQPYTHTLLASNVARNMAVVAGATTADATTISGAVSTTIATTAVQALEAARTGNTLSEPPTVAEVTTVLTGAGVPAGDPILEAAINAAKGLTVDGVTKLSGGASIDNVIGAVVAAESLMSYQVFADNTDKARVLAVGMYVANRDYSATEGVPSKYVLLAGDTSGTIKNATDATDVVNQAVRFKDASGNLVIKDVPVGNILKVIRTFSEQISKGRSIDDIARAAVEADAGTNGKKNLTFESAKVIAAAGVAAAQAGATVADAQSAATNMSKVLAARDASAAAAPQAKAGEKVTVPRWMINTDGQNTYPPTPLIDVTGKTIPTDPTLEFDPPNTDAGGTKPYNPPLAGQKAAGRMLSIVLDAINRVSSTRGELGAIEGRFTSNIANLNNVVENLSGARSRILDADIAAETANLTKLSILQQAGTAILAQANQLPQLALQLLK
ncbi:flagellin [Candidatus Magnetaquicoccus inordinatus]|uniref:flagellin N-terminal helical domain-containing protein n=1 Tax=Candidatus Magnetaquicoccus inordinatus TaxID=2496818 RepID=UPI00102CAEB8|nr:flagellin [Candidatus Magnetaquicoccus inordinatus]